MEDGAFLYTVYVDIFGVQVDDGYIGHIVSLFSFLRKVFMTGHLDTMFELSVSRAQYGVTSHKEKLIENAFQHVSVFLVANLMSVGVGIGLN